MKPSIKFIGVIILASMCIKCTAPESRTAENSVKNSLKKKAMKLNAGIITTKLTETKDFYCNKLGFGVSFENDFYLLLHTPGHTAEISFLLPDHPSQQPVFKPAFQGQGVYLTIEVEDVDSLYQTLQQRGLTPLFPLRDEPWGDRHFALADPNGVGIDFVKYAPPQQ